MNSPQPPVDCKVKPDPVFSDPVFSHSRFSIGFDPRDKKRLFALWDDVLTSQKWTEGRYTRLFEERWAGWNGVEAVATSSWSGAALACMDYFKLAGKKVLCPTNTFMATPLAVRKGGGEVVFGDCNREDLCLSYAAVREAWERHAIAAAWLVHIGGHLAFDTPRIADFCREKGIVMLEDCAHAHGASWNGKKPGTWGDAGVFSLYATKTLTTGEGGVLVSMHAGLLDFARRYRNYGKFSYEVEGLNFRMSEFTAALGVIQIERLADFVEQKNEVAERLLDSRFPRRVRLPEGMVSGYYKYIVFEPIERSTGKVYEQLCHKILRQEGAFPNSEWVSKNHWCVPLYYAPRPGRRRRPTDKEVAP